MSENPFCSYEIGFQVLSTATEKPLRPEFFLRNIFASHILAHQEIGVRALSANATLFFLSFVLTWLKSEIAELMV